MGGGGMGMGMGMGMRKRRGSATVLARMFLHDGALIPKDARNVYFADINTRVSHSATTTLWAACYNQK